MLAHLDERVCGGLEGGEVLERDGELVDRGLLPRLHVCEALYDQIPHLGRAHS